MSTDDSDQRSGRNGQAGIGELLAIMRRLRDPRQGCPWDRAQDFSTIAPYTIEESYEVAEAIARKDYPELKDELGDLLFQVVFHAQMAQEAGHFRFEDVVRAICDKMHRRHPHVFGDEPIATAEAQTQVWEEHKARERREKAAGKPTGLLDDVPLALPGLTRANKLGKRAATVGFEWPDWTGAREKVGEELTELDEALAQDAPRERLQHELGDVLFAVVNLARYLGIDPEAALRGCNGRFAERFGFIEAQAAEQGLRLQDMSLEEMDALWDEAKARQQG